LKYLERTFYLDSFHSFCDWLLLCVNTGICKNDNRNHIIPHFISLFSVSLAGELGYTTHPDNLYYKGVFFSNGIWDFLCDNYAGIIYGSCMNSSGDITCQETGLVRFDTQSRGGKAFLLVMHP